MINIFRNLHKTELKKYYSISACVLLNVIVLLILINMVLWIAFIFKDQATAKRYTKVQTTADGIESQKLFKNDGSPLDNGKRTGYQFEWFDYNAYERFVNEKYAGTVLDDFYNLEKHGFIYQPWVEFSEPVYKGKLVNVDMDTKGFPIRRTINPKIEENELFVNIFTLGGSTTFGYNVSDEHTWPTYLSNILNERVKSAGLSVKIKVSNYGRGFYFPSQETLLLMDLLKAGHHPNLVIFMDGVNWGTEQDIPQFSSKFAQMFKDLQFSRALLQELDWMPMMRALNFLKGVVIDKNKVVKKDDDDAKEFKEDLVRHIINRFESNRHIAICVSELYGTRNLFFLQPDAVYNYSHSLYRLSLPDSFLKIRPLRQQFYMHMKTKNGYIDLTDLFELWGNNRKAIVDDVHYSPAFNRFLAQHVADHIDIISLVKGLKLDVSITTEVTGITGAPRHDFMNSLSNSPLF